MNSKTAAEQITEVKFEQDKSRIPKCNWNAGFELKPDPYAGYPHIGTYGSYGELNNCGIRCLSRISGRAVTEEKKQNVVYILLDKGDYIQYLMALSTYQLEYWETQLFIELGAEEIKVTPNQYHKPNNSHLFLLNLHFNPKILKYVDIIRMPIEAGDGNYGSYAVPGVYCPRWYTDALLAKEKEGYVEPIPSPVPSIQPFPPARVLWPPYFAADPWYPHAYNNLGKV